jgi:hypothetical protein
MKIPVNEHTTVTGKDSAPIASDKNSVNYFAVMFKPESVPIEEIIITVDQEIEYGDIDEQEKWEWYNTGEPFVKPDYLGMINDLGERV